MALKNKNSDMFLKIFQLIIKVLGFSSFFPFILLFFSTSNIFFSLRDLPDFLHSYSLFPFKKILSGSMEYFMSYICKSVSLL